jgi:hypothetical protein
MRLKSCDFKTHIFSTCYPVFRDRTVGERAGAINIALGGLSQACLCTLCHFAGKIYENHGGGFRRRASVDTWPQIKNTTTHKVGKITQISGSSRANPHK